jgi:50S ribosomal subunit-associated GTPase HflX
LEIPVLESPAPYAEFLLADGNLMFSLPLGLLSSCMNNPFVVVVANKSDLLDLETAARHLETMRIMEQDSCLKTLLVSAKSGEQVEELFQFVAAEVLHRCTVSIKSKALDLNGTRSTDPDKNDRCC